MPKIVKVKVEPLAKLIFSFSALITFSFIYTPGLTGGFILDDFGNLKMLGEFNGIRNFDTFIKFIGNGIAGPTGRPISLLSFLLNGSNWPTDPYPFKLTNVILHGINGYFLFLLCRLLFISRKFNQEQAGIGALIATSFWLLHPFFVSTVLYVVQRMAMLSAFFSLVGLWLYCKGRLLLRNTEPQTQNRKAYILTSLGIGLGTILAVLSKENGVLLPLLAACVEFCNFSHPESRTQPLNRYWQVLFFALPSLGVIILLLREINPYVLSHPLGGRNFSLPERLLTESRIVCGYLYNLLIPKLSYPGILNENIEISKSLLQPLTTLFSSAFIFALLGLGFKLRRSYSFVSLAILFFFAGHLLESTTLGLELYFEHRNYLPAIFLFLPAGELFIRQQKQLIKVFVISLLLICALFTYQYSSLWGNSLALSLSWAKQNPGSSRAQRTAALNLEETGDSQSALILLEQAKTNIPDSLDLYWHWFMLKCQMKGTSASDLDQMLAITQKAEFDAHHFNVLKTTVETLISPECKGTSGEYALKFLDRLLTNPGISKDQRLAFQPHHLKGLVYVSTKRPDEALAEYTTVLNLTQNVEHGLVQASELASRGYYSQALEHLYAVEAVLKNQPQTKSTLFNTKLDYPSEIARIRANLLEDIKKQH